MSTQNAKPRGNKLQLLPSICTFLALYSDANTSRAPIVPMLVQPYTLQIQSTLGFSKYINRTKQLVQLFLKIKTWNKENEWIFDI